jgi:hypothetical protein
MRYPFIKLPARVETALFLIRAELKTRNFFNRLQDGGFANDNTQCHLTELIAERLGIDVRRDENFEKFSELLEDASEKVEPNMENEELMKIVLGVYIQIVTAKNERVD